MNRLRTFIFASIVLVQPLAWPSVNAATLTTWADFSSFPPNGIPTTYALGGGSSVDITVTTGGNHGLNGADLGVTGAAETGLDYSHLRTLAIFNGPGNSTVVTSFTFSSFIPGPDHVRGLLFVGAINGQSSPITLTSSVAGAVQTWPLAGAPFTINADNDYEVTWNPISGTIITTAPIGIDSKGICIDIGAIDQYGTITITLNQHLNDGILYGVGEEVDTARSGTAEATLPPIGLSVAWPNPFSHVVNLAYDISAPSPVTVSILDVAGRLVRSMVDDSRSPGRYSLSWDGQDGSGRSLAPGVYYVRLTALGHSQTRKIVYRP